MKTLCAVAFLMLSPCFAFGQDSQGQTSKPGPEVQKLSYYIGTWEGHGQAHASPFGPAGALSSRQTCSWFAGKFQVICKGVEHGPTGSRTFLNLLSYDEAAKSYTEYSISSLGGSEYDPGGSLDGNKLSFLISQDLGGKSAKFLYTEVHVSPTLMTYAAEASVDGAPWMVIGDGKIRKVK